MTDHFIFIYLFIYFFFGGGLKKSLFLFFIFFKFIFLKWDGEEFPHGKFIAESACVGPTMSHIHASHIHTLIYTSSHIYIYNVL